MLKSNSESKFPLNTRPPLLHPTALPAGSGTITTTNKEKKK